MYACSEVSIKYAAGTWWKMSDCVWAGRYTENQLEGFGSEDGSGEHVFLALVIDKLNRLGVLFEVLD